MQDPGANADNRRPSKAIILTMKKQLTSVEEKNPMEIICRSSNLKVVMDLVALKSFPLGFREAVWPSIQEKLLMSPLATEMLMNLELLLWYMTLSSSWLGSLVVWLLEKFVIRLTTAMDKMTNEFRKDSTPFAATSENSVEILSIFIRKC